MPRAYALISKPYSAGEALTIGNVGDLTKDVVSADLFITLWWADQRLADHSNIDFGTNAPVCGLEVKQKCKRKQSHTNLTVANLTVTRVKRS